jgi:hypothetical protein
VVLAISFFDGLLLKKLKSKLFLASMKLLPNYENPLQRACRGYFIHENAYSKPPVILKNQAAYEGKFTRQPIRDRRWKTPTIEKKIGTNKGISKAKQSNLFDIL